MIDLQRLEGLSVEDKRELLRNLVSLRPGDSRAPVPLSYGQQSLWFVYQLAPTSPAYNFLYAARILSTLDRDAFVRACHALVDRHPALRTRFVVQDNKPMQVIEDRLDIAVPISDATNWPEERLVEGIRQRADEPFDLERGPALRIELYKRSASEYVLVLVFHHIIADLWSMDLLVQELEQLYQGERSGQKPSLPALPAQFADFVRWQTLSVHGQRGQKSFAYWQNVLSGELPVLNLPTDRPRPPVQTYNGTSHSWQLSRETTSKLRQLVKKHQSTSFMGLLGVYQLLLHRLSAQDDLLVGTAVADRGRPEWEQLVGYFLNQVVLRADFTADRSFRDLLEQTRDQVHRALDHQDFPFGLIVKKLQPRRDPSRSPIFQVMFIWDKPRDLEVPFGANGAEACHAFAAGKSLAEHGGSQSAAKACHPGKSLRMEPLLMEQRGAPFDLTLIVFEIGDTLTASFRYNTDLFDSATIERMAENFNTLLDGVLARPEAPLSQVPILTVDQHRQLVIDLNQTRVPYEQGCFHDLFEKQVARVPEAPAILFEDLTLSYGELNRAANQLARHLQSLGAQRGDTAAISLPRGPDAIIAVLAAWKAGAAYMFLDPAYPSKRLTGMVQDAQPVVMVAPAQVPDWPLATVQLPAEWSTIKQLPGHNLDLPRSPEDKAYIIYTSGSTGQPKGTLLRHQGLPAMALAHRHIFGIEPSDRVLQFASLSFDASVYEITQALLSGASLVLGTQASILPGPGLLELLEKKKVSVATMPPSVLAVLPAQALPDLRTMIVAGESCAADVVAAWGPGRRFFNLYGPTEATVWSTFKECLPDGKAPTIGKPIPNSRVYVLDRWLQPVPIGVPGELFLAGPGIAVGYMNQPELTAERFLPNPFDPADGGVMYRTGDLVRWTVDGELEFLGRKDHQLKIRGYRIELEEIQEVLRRHPEVADAVVVARHDGNQQPARDEPYLAAYVVPRSMASFPLPEVRAFLRERLPHYMLPAAVMPLEALPLSVAGKVDRNRLPAPTTEHDAARHIVAPRNPVENLLAEVWGQVLKVDRFGIHDNFFDLGGASIQTLEVVSLANARGLSLAPEMLFRYQTIADLAAACGPLNGALDQGRGTRDEGRGPELAPLPISLSPLAAPARSSATLGGALVESLGVYLPDKTVPTEQVIKDCRVKLDFPLERLTGIRNRRMAGDTEFSIDLAEKAAAECLRRSRHRPEDIDLLICCNISRYDGPELRFGMEPTSAARIRSRFGLVNAVAFDITNACAGTFTALGIVDTLLRNNAIRRAMVVSGEYITHLTRTAQQEIENFMDSRLACLTLGDSGVAMVLEQAPTSDVGFQEIELYTLGKYHGLCVAKLTRESRGGAIMYTDPVKSAAVTIRQAVSHAVEVLRRKHWDPETVDALVMHQTSETTLDGAVREINRALGKPVCSRSNTVYNVAERGNTATNSHFLAIYERIQAGDLEAGDRVLFAVSGSGQTVGTALYLLDDLPKRLRQPLSTACVSRSEGASERETQAKTGGVRHFRLQRPVRIESIGIIPGAVNQPADTATMLKHAGEACLQGSARPRDEIDLLIHTGVYRTDFLSEPALAAIAAGDLQINHDDETTPVADAPGSPGPRRTLALDLMSGAAGALTGAFVAAQLIAAGKFCRALILASEVENNAQTWPENLLGIKETASAFILEGGAKDQGFVSFGFRSFPELVDGFESYTGAHRDLPVVFHPQDPEWEQQVAECARTAVEEFLRKEELKLSDLKWVVPPQAAPGFRRAIAEALAVPRDRLVDLGEDKDLFTSSLAHCLAYMREKNKLRCGDRALFIEVAAGVQVACALYQF